VLARDDILPPTAGSSVFDWYQHAGLGVPFRPRRHLMDAQQQSQQPLQEQQSTTATKFVQEMGVAYRYNDVPQHLSETATVEDCAAACLASKAAGCIAWTWLPARSTALPSTCSLKSARGTVIDSAPGAVSGYLAGEAGEARAAECVPACL
jgi:hypothetical protein